MPSTPPKASLSQSVSTNTKLKSDQQTSHNSSDLSCTIRHYGHSPQQREARDVQDPNLLLILRGGREFRTMSIKLMPYETKLDLESLCRDDPSCLHLVWNQQSHVQVTLCPANIVLFWTGLMLLSTSVMHQ